MNCELIYDYKENYEYRRSFNNLANKVFGIDFEKWYQAGFWDDRYVCYSIFENENIISNVSITKQSINSNNKNINSIQIGTVMTSPEYRNKGFASKLIKNVLDEYSGKSDLIFLFGNKDVKTFYNKFGFRIINEYKFYTKNNFKSRNNIESRKINIDNKDDLDLALRLSKNNKLLSEKFKVYNSNNILAWHLMNLFSEDIYYFKDFNLVLICKKNEDEIDIYNVFSDINTDIRIILENIVSDDINRINFLFTPNFGEVDIESELYTDGDYDFHIKTNGTNFDYRFMFPYNFHI
ncbi:MAG: GNAT family N-acetyltransferase [Clostridiales bacterium]